VGEREGGGFKVCGGRGVDEGERERERERLGGRGE
jgi:hypothetical protein